MKISILIDREPFDKIFEDTFSSFLKDLTNFSHQVKWKLKTNNNEIKDSVQTWYCNPLINSIFVKGADSLIFESINGEYSNNPLKPWRSPIQRLYLKIVQHRVTSSFFSKYIVYISPPIKNAAYHLIIGGNTKIRLFNILEKKAYVILKDGYDKKYIDRDIYVRKNFRYLPIPNINQFSTNGLWYCEDYITGLSPDRIGGAKGKNILLEAIQHLHLMLNQTKSSVSLNKYLLNLRNKIIHNLNSITHIGDNDKNSIFDLLFQLDNYFDKHSNQNIITAYCHGDFQEGNIIYDGEKTWILDWEFSGKRQIGYDLFVLILKSRVHNDFPNRFFQFYYNQLDGNLNEIVNKWPELKSNKRLYSIIFLLEELDFHLEENNNHHFYTITHGLISINEHIKIILKKII